MADNTSPLTTCFGGLDGNQDIYKMSANKRGFCCLFLNQNFYKTNQSKTPFEVREGADLDINRLSDEFERLKFDIRSFNDLSRDQIFTQLDQLLMRRSELRSHDAFVAVFSSHGNASLIVDKYAKTILIDEIMQKFSSKNCPDLVNKPKILIFLCCRGSETLDGVDISEDAVLSGIDWDEGHTDDDLVAVYQDIIICYSTVHKYFSLRYPDEGTIYGNILANNLRDYSNNKDLEYILRKCAQHMSQHNIEYDGKPQKLISSVKCIGWRKMLYFNPDHPRE